MSRFEINAGVVQPRKKPKISQNSYNIKSVRHPPSSSVQPTVRTMPEHHSTSLQSTIQPGTAHMSNITSQPVASTSQVPSAQGQQASPAAASNTTSPYYTPNAYPSYAAPLHLMGNVHSIINDIPYALSAMQTLLIGYLTRIETDVRQYSTDSLSALQRLEKCEADAKENREHGQAEVRQIAGWIEKAFVTQTNAMGRTLKRVEHVEKMLGRPEDAIVITDVDTGKEIMNGGKSMMSRLETVECLLMELLEKTSDPDAEKPLFERQNLVTNPTINIRHDAIQEGVHTGFDPQLRVEHCDVGISAVHYESERAFVSVGVDATSQASAEDVVMREAEAEAFHPSISVQTTELVDPIRRVVSTATSPILIPSIRRAPLEVPPLGLNEGLKRRNTEERQRSSGDSCSGISSLELVEEASYSTEADFKINASAEISIGEDFVVLPDSNHSSQSQLDLNLEGELSIEDEHEPALREPGTPSSEIDSTSLKPPQGDIASPILISSATPSPVVSKPSKRRRARSPSLEMFNILPKSQFGRVSSLFNDNGGVEITASSESHNDSLPLQPRKKTKQSSNKPVALPPRSTSWDIDDVPSPPRVARPTKRLRVSEPIAGSSKVPSDTDSGDVATPSNFVTPRSSRLTKSWSDSMSSLSSVPSNHEPDSETSSTAVARALARDTISTASPSSVHARQTRSPSKAKELKKPQALLQKRRKTEPVRHVVFSTASQPASTSTANNLKKRKSSSALAYQSITPKHRNIIQGTKGSCNWPEMFIDGNSRYKNLILCDRCNAWYHWGCVDIAEGDERTTDKAEFICPPCDQSSDKTSESRKHLKIRDQRCARPQCDIPTTAGSEFFVERLIGRQPQVDGDEEAHPLQYNYLVKWEGYATEESTWEPSNSLSNARKLISAFERAASQEGLRVDNHDGKLILAEARDAGYR